MDKFVEKHAAAITGVISCFDRVLFKGHLYLRKPYVVEQLLHLKGLRFKDFKAFALEQAERIKTHATTEATKAGRPWQYLNGRVRKEDRAREIAERDGIREGLVCVFTQLEPCRTFQLVFGKEGPRLASARRKCLFVYWYFMDPEFGLLHVKLQTWLPFTIQVYVNGHAWLARRMDAEGIGYVRCDNAFRSISDPRRAQDLADQFVRLDWPKRLDELARRVNPLFPDLLGTMRYYWVTDQAEYSTDVMFKERDGLRDLYRRLVDHATRSFSAEDVLRFLGRKLNSHFEGEVLTDYKKRLPGVRIKHRMKENWIKMYDKYGAVLRVETVINNPYEFKVRREGKRRGAVVMGWFPMAKGVANLFRYAEVSMAANRRYLNALSVVDSPRPAYQTLEHLARAIHKDGRSTRGFNPVDRRDVRIFQAVMRGEHAIAGFRNRDVRRHLFPGADASGKTPLRRQSARVSRVLKRLHVHGLIAKIPRTRRWRATDAGHLLMSAAIQLRDEYFPEVLRATG